MRIDNVNALITGASAGIGREFARQLAPRARSLILVARREQRLNELRSELIRSQPSLVIHVRKTDLADLSQVQELVAWLEREKLDVDLLINNAGLGDLGQFATSESTRNDQMILVNVAALTSLTRKLLPQMISRKRGAILNVSSSAGFLPIPEFNVYAATKAYVTSFSESLHAELCGTGVTVTALCPGPVQTEFQELAHRPGGKPDSAPEFVYVSVEKVVRDAIVAVEAHRPLVIPGFIMKLGMFLVRLTPMPILRLTWRLKGKHA
jgi:short-subunit dehydrogenase